MKLSRFNEDMIRRGVSHGDDIPADAMALIHDLCYHHDGRDVWSYVERAQQILKRTKSPYMPGYSRRRP